MRNKFRGYYKPTEAEENSMWASAHIVMDTNVVLDLYKYHAKTTDLYLRSLRAYKVQLWLPYQVALEFHKNRPKVRAETTKAHKERIKDLKSIKNKIQANTPKSKLESSTVEDELIAKTDQAILSLEGELQKLLAETHVNSRDVLLDHITELFDGRVGDAPTRDELRQLHEVAKLRFDELVPPGYEDRKSKPPGEEYGDFLLWRQVMDYAKSQEADIIIATEDNKSDWWQKINGDDIVGPRPELVQEFRSETGREIIFYSGRDFFRQLSDRAQISESSEELAGALADVTSVSDERSAAELARLKEFQQQLRHSRGSVAEHELTRRKQLSGRGGTKDDEEAALRGRLADLQMREHQMQAELGELMFGLHEVENAKLSGHELPGRREDLHVRLGKIQARRADLRQQLSALEEALQRVQLEREIKLELWREFVSDRDFEPEAEESDE